MLVKFNSGINFINILLAAFLYKSFVRSFFVLTFYAGTFWRKNIGAKAALKNVGEIIT
jgi:hypothetical protein